MNNNQFRRLLLEQGKKDGELSGTPRTSSTPGLGSKKGSFMPMTPRTVRGTNSGDDFARQVRERNAALQPRKKFKSSAAPKGSKLAAGYRDRTQDRVAPEADDRAARIKALEEQMKLGLLPLETFEALRDQIIGDDASASYLVKGLDMKLLERVRRGEDVLGLRKSREGEEQEAVQDVDEELEKIGEQELQAVHREKKEKTGSMAPPPLAGVKRSRDEIMADFKAQRQAEKGARIQALLGPGFRKVSDKERARTQIDSKGREVIITVDEDGTVKRRVRNSTEDGDHQSTTAAMPDASAPVIGAEIAIPELQKPAEAEDSDDDIFEGVGMEYNPLGDDKDLDESSADEAEAPNSQVGHTAAKDEDQPSAQTKDSAENAEMAAMQPPHPPTGVESGAKRNYFGDKPAVTAEETANPLANMQDVLKKAAKLDPLRLAEAEDGHEDASEGVREARLQKRAAMLANQDRDLEDMDLGFGSSRFGDEEDGAGGKKVKLAEWRGSADGGWEEDKGKAGGGKKRKPKKRKGDVNNAADILRVIEGRKGGTN